MKSLRISCQLFLYHTKHMTALENLRYFSLLFGIPSPDYDKILKMVGLQNAEKRKPVNFPLG